MPDLEPVTLSGANNRDLLDAMPDIEEIGVARLADDSAFEAMPDVEALPTTEVFAQHLDPIDLQAAGSAARVETTPVAARARGIQSWRAAQIGAVLCVIVSGLALLLTNLASSAADSFGTPTAAANSTTPSANFTQLGTIWPQTLPGAPQVNALLADPADSRVLFAATSGGVLRSQNGGGAWAISGGWPTDMAARSLAFDAQDPDLPLYVGTYGGGIYRSSDGGETWKNVGLGGRTVTAVAAVNKIVYAGVSAPATLAGLYRSDEPDKWLRPGSTPVSGRDTPPADTRMPPTATADTPLATAQPAVSDTLFDVRAIAVDPTQPQNIYISTAYARGSDDYARVKRSRDGGKTWQAVGTTRVASGNLTPSPLGLNPQGIVEGLAVVWPAPAAPAPAGSAQNEQVRVGIQLERVYATDGQAVYRLSPDGGTWNDLALPGDAHAAGLSADPQTPNVVYVATTTGIWRVDTGGKWRQVASGAFGAGLMVSAVPDKGSAAPTVNPLNLNAKPGDSTLLYAIGKNGQLARVTNADFTVDTVVQVATPQPGSDAAIAATAIAANSGRNPAARIANPNYDPKQFYFVAETGHLIGGGFRTYWLANGRERLLGFPLTEEFQERGRRRQNPYRPIFREGTARTRQQYHRHRHDGQRRDPAHRHIARLRRERQAAAAGTLHRDRRRPALLQQRQAHSTRRVLSLLDGQRRRRTIRAADLGRATRDRPRHKQADHGAIF